ncbi:flavin reductase [Candidatus Poribacteria bacterium]|nr:flavin reductase [Candidatus Poribacteria bacterium]
MGRFATGVTLVTTRCGEHIWGMTANAVMSLSLHPPLVLVSVNRRSQMHEHLTHGKCFAVNVLTSEQEAISRRFAAPGPKDFSGLTLTVAETGAPILVDALAFVDCRLVQVVSGGDHDMFIGEPVAGEARDGQPLIFYGGQYTQLSPPTTEDP